MKSLRLKILLLDNNKFYFKYHFSSFLSNSNSNVSSSTVLVSMNTSIKIILLIIFQVPKNMKKPDCRLKNGTLKEDNLQMYISGDMTHNLIAESSST